MSEFYFNKLVRDKVLENCLNEPETLETNYRVLNDEEFPRELIRKISEEANEIPTHSGADRKEILAELADLQTVVDTLRQHFGLSKAELQEAVARKIAEKGDFSGKYYIESVVLADNSPWIAYFRANPKRYLEK